MDQSRWATAGKDMNLMMDHTDTRLYFSF